jgi:hypothetical protein
MMRLLTLVSLLVLAGPASAVAQVRSFAWTRLEPSYLGPELLTDVVAVIPFGRAGALVQQTGDPRLVIAPEPGVPTFRFGRDGEGPGEYRNLRRLGRSARGFWISDQVLRRVTWIDTAGRMQEIVPHLREIRGRDGRLSAATISPIAIGTGGGMIVEAGATGPVAERSGWAAGLGEGEMALLSLSRVGAVRRELERIPSAATLCTESRSINGLGILLPRPLCVPPIVVTGPDGTVALVRVGNDRVALSVYSVDGVLHHRTTFGWQGRRVTPDLRDSVRRYARQQLRIPAVADAFDAQPLPVTTPAVRRAVVSGAGAVWLKFESDVHPNLWRLIDRTGQLAGEVRLEDGMRVVAAEGQVLWVQEESPDGEPRLVRLSVRS